MLSTRTICLNYTNFSTRFIYYFTIYTIYIWFVIILFYRIYYSSRVVEVTFVSWIHFGSCSIGKRISEDMDFLFCTSGRFWFVSNGFVIVWLRLHFGRKGFALIVNSWELLYWFLKTFFVFIIFVRKPQVPGSRRFGRSSFSNWNLVREDTLNKHATI